MLFLQLYLIDHVLVYLATCLIVELWNRPKSEGSDVRVWDLVLTVGTNLSLSGFILYPLISSTDRLPYRLPVWFGLAIAALLYEVLFYWIHRALHQGNLFYCIHRIHHRYRIPTPWSTLYAHPLEHLFLNTFPAVLSLFASGLDPLYLEWLVVLGTMSATLSHSLSRRLTAHAQDQSGNYGVWGLMDRWMRTTLR